MRRLTLLALVLALAFSSACKRKRRVRAEPANAQLLSTIAMNDPLAPIQLVRGFYQLEGGAWRWTAKSFAVVVRPPEDAAQRGARLEFKLTLPDVIAQKVGAIRLSAVANGRALEPEQYTQPGEHTYTREIPPGVLTGEGAMIEFTCDKALPASGGDARELALIAASVALYPANTK